MALIICPECGNQKSQQAKRCPMCGYPFSHFEKKLFFGKQNKIFVVLIVFSVSILIIGGHDVFGMSNLEKSVVEEKEEKTFKDNVEVISVRLRIE